MDYTNAFVELPGEANPLSRDGLIKNLALGAGRSAGTNDLQVATKQLQEWESQSCYYLELQSVFIDQDLPFEVRYLAILQLLNSVTNKRAWVRNNVHGVNAQDKQQIRSQLLVSSYREPDDRLARQNALLVAKIVRSEFPQDWPNVFDDLNMTISGDFDHQNPVHLLQMRRALELLEAIVKEMAKATLRISALRSKAPDILEPVHRIFQSCSEQFINMSEAGFSIHDGNALGLLLPATKIIRRLLARGYKFPEQDDRAVFVFQNVSQFWQARMQQQDPAGNGETSSSKQNFEKVLLGISKMHLELSEDNPGAYIQLSASALIHQQYLEIIQKFAQPHGFALQETSGIQTNSDATGGSSFIEKLVLKGILVVRATMRPMSDPNAIRPRTAEEKAQKEKIIEVSRRDFFNEQIVHLLFVNIVGKYFVFTKADLRRWEDEPDEWEAAEGGDTEGYRFSVRLSAEKLFLDLVYNFTDNLVPSIISHAATTMADPTLDAVRKESVYTALGLAADKIFVHLQKSEGGFDFNKTLDSLIQDLQNRDPSYRLIRRRIAILIGKWVHIQISKDNRPLVYQIYLHLLDKSDEMNDLVVRVTAGRQVENAISDWEFQAEPFLPYAPDIISRLMDLIAEVELPETKMALLGTISTIVQQLGKHIAPFADHIVSILPALWDETGEETLRKQEMVTLLINMLSSMGTESTKYQNFMLFIIKAVLSPDSKLPELERMALLPDALDLWRAVLENTASVSVSGLHPDLLILLRTSLIPVLGVDSEARRLALEIASAYILIIPAEFIAEHAFIVELLRSQAPDLRSLKPEASAQVFEVAEHLLRAAEELASSHGVQTVTAALIESNFLREVFLGLRESYQAHQTTGPKAMVSNVQGMVETDFLSITARIMYASPDLFVTILRDPQLGLDADVPSTMDWFLEEYLPHAQELTMDSSRQKLLTMAVTRLLTTTQPFILSRLQQLIDLWISVIESLTHEESTDCLVYPAPDGPPEPGDGQSAGEARKAALQAADPIHIVNLRDLVKHAVGVAIEKCGGTERFQNEWLVNVDKEVLEQFGRLRVV